MRKTISFLALVIAVALAIIAACSSSETPTGPSGRGLNVQPAWQGARQALGHQVHVVDAQVPCAACHDLAGDSLAVASPGRCSACHERESRIQHAELAAQKRFGPAVTADCTACHAFGGRAELDGSVSHASFSADECARCHGVAQGAIPAVVVHGAEDCVSCHHPHRDATPQPGPCVDCHREPTTSHAASGKSAVQVCTTCHQHQHAPASEAIGTCQACHERHEPLVPATALFAGGHRECVGCHEPHDFGKRAALPCRSCHAELHVLAAARVPAHDQCTSCHAPHDVRKSPAQACVGCHAGVHPEHPKLGDQGSCVGCHQPHPAASGAHDTARACSGCHQTAHADNGLHGGVSCTQCHEPHAFVLARGELAPCRACHAQQFGSTARNAGHQDCKGCHGGLPHHPAAASVQSCATCHASEAHEANRGHQQCTSCHEPHSGSRTQPCQGCHAPEARSAPAGHASCTSCHQPHSGAPAQAACASCHAAEAQSKHGQLPGACLNCHRPHGPGGVASPPACATCHATSSLAGLHTLSKHQNCSSCHSGGHTEKPSHARDACLGCHMDRKSHFPTAPSCASCHLFGK